MASNACLFENGLQCSYTDGSSLHLHLFLEFNCVRVSKQHKYNQNQLEFELRSTIRFFINKAQKQALPSNSRRKVDNSWFKDVYFLSTASLKSLRAKRENCFSVRESQHVGPSWAQIER